MKLIFNSSIIKEDSIFFWIYVGLICIMIILTILLVKKELNNRK